jgi:hypothetical protein
MGKTKLYVRDDAVRLDRLAAVSVCVFVSPVQTTVLASYLEWLDLEVRASGVCMRVFFNLHVRIAVYVNAS